MKALVIGAFDPPHLGHALLFRHAEQYGELHIGVNSDRFYQQHRGHPPLFTETERIGVVSAWTQRVHLNDGPGFELIRQLKPGYLVVGTPWTDAAPPDDFYGQRAAYLVQIRMSEDELDDLGCVLLLADTRPAGWSGSEIRRRLS